MSPNNLKIGILFTLISALAYAIVTIIVKIAAHNVPTLVIIFIQMAVSLVLLSSLLVTKSKNERQQLMQSKILPIHLLRTVFSLGIGFCLFYAVRFIPLIDAVLLANTAPLLVPFIALIFLRKPINHRLWLPLVIGFVGVAIILNPDGHIFNAAALIAFASAICMASSMLLIRHAATQDNKITTLYYYFLFGTIISGLVSIPFWHSISLTVTVALIGSGVLFFLVQYTLTLALAQCDATIVSSLYYANIIFAAILSMLIWHTTFSVLTILGTLLAIVGGIMVIRANKIASTLPWNKNHERISASS